MKISLYRFKSRLDTAKKKKTKTKKLHKLENRAKQNHPQVYRRKNMVTKITEPQYPVEYQIVYVKK